MKALIGSIIGGIIIVGIIVLILYDNYNHGSVPILFDTTIDTEGTSLPEIIVDEKKLEKLPKPTAPKQNIEEITGQQNTEETATRNEQTNDATHIQIIETPNKSTQNLEDIPEEINLDVPFFAQAPDGDRGLPWKEACEEASIVLAAHYLKNKKLTKAVFKDHIISMTYLQQDLFDTYIDTSIAQTQQLYEEFYGIGRTKIIDNPTVKQLKYELAQGRIIVAPFAGKELGNSHFTNGGPRYHMLVIRGYDDTYFYTNDVGTSHGDNFPYTHKVLINAMHDLTDGDITKGEKRVLVLMR